MTPRAALVLAALLAAGCSSSSEPRPMGSAAVTLFGPGARLETWKTSVVEGWHVHPSQSEDPCTVPVMAEMVGVLGSLQPDREKSEKLNKAMGDVMTHLCANMHGKSYGGKGRVAVVLRHYGEDGRTADEALVVDLPALQPGETERLFKKGEFQAAFQRPPRTEEALLERGWVRARRIDRGSSEFELFLVLKPARPDAGYESLQCVARVDSSRR